MGDLTLSQFAALYAKVCRHENIMDTINHTSFGFDSRFVFDGEKVGKPEFKKRLAELFNENIEEFQGSLQSYLLGFVRKKARLSNLIAECPQTYQQNLSTK